MPKTLYNIQLTNTGSGQLVYDENLPFYDTEPQNEEIVSFIKLIRPNLRYDLIQHSFVRELKETEY